MDILIRFLHGSIPGYTGHIQGRHSEDSGEPRLALTPRRTKSPPPSGRPRGLAEGVASSSKAEIGSRSPRCSEIASRAPRRSELVPEKAFSEKVSVLTLTLALP